MFRLNAVRRRWFRWAMAAVAIGYAARSLARNEPYWEPDVDYLHWSTDVPAVTVCPSSPRSPFVTVTDESTPQNSDIDHTLSVNILKWTNELKKKDGSVLCRNTFKNCSWNGKCFNCCRHFQPNRFVVGKPCFSINSLQTVNKRKKLVISHFTKSGVLKIEFNEPVEISLHHPVEIRFGDLEKRYITVNTNEESELLYTIQQTIDHVSLAIFDEFKRGCLLRSEKMLFHHPVYSKSTCLLECLLHKPDTYAKNSTLCDCLPTCAEMEINYVWNGTRRSDDNATRCILTMSKPTTVRLVMKAKKDYLDSIVIIACLIQLFCGTNLMDIANYIMRKNHRSIVFNHLR